MKRTIFFSIIVVFLLLICSCGADTPIQTTDGESASVQAPGESEMDTGAIETEDEAEKLTVIFGGQSEYKLIVPEGTDAARSLVFSAFSNQLCERFSCSIKSEFDLMAMLKPSKADAKEIIIGDTAKEESKALAGKLVSKGGNCFGILVVDNKIVINGTSWYQCYLALDYFLEQFSSVDENGVPMLAIESGYEYISEQSEDKIFDLAELVKEGREFSFFATDRVIYFESRNGASTTQGGCTDGKYIYVGLMGTESGLGDYGVISKYDLATGELVAYSEKLPLYHTNDITYDSKNDRLVVATLDAGWTRLAIVDPNTLEYLGDLIAPVGIRGLEYIAETNTYIAASFYLEIMVLDENFNKISSHVCEDQTLMTQGLYSDGQFVYDPRYLSGKSVHLLVLEDMNGNLIASADIYGLAAAEPEHFFTLNGKMYLGCNHADSLFELQVIPKDLW